MIEALLRLYAPTSNLPGGRPAECLLISAKAVHLSCMVAWGCWAAHLLPEAAGGALLALQPTLRKAGAVRERCLTSTWGMHHVSVAPSQQMQAQALLDLLLSCSATTRKLHQMREYLRAGEPLASCGHPAAQAEPLPEQPQLACGRPVLPAQHDAALKSL